MIIQNFTTRIVIQNNIEPLLSPRLKREIQAIKETVTIKRNTNSTKTKRGSIRKIIIYTQVISQQFKCLCECSFYFQVIVQGSIIKIIRHSPLLTWYYLKTSLENNKIVPTN